MSSVFFFLLGGGIDIVSKFYSYAKQQWISTDNFGSGYRKVNYIPLSVREFEKFQKEANKGREKWSYILESGFISTNDIIRCLCQNPDLRNTWDSVLRNNRLYVDEKLKSSGYYSYKDRSIYKDGSVFWKIDEIEHCFPDIRSQIEVFIDKYTPKEEYWNGEVISLYYGYSKERFFVEEVRKKKAEHDKRMRELERMLWMTEYYVNQDDLTFDLSEEIRNEIRRRDLWGD